MWPFLWSLKVQKKNGHLKFTTSYIHFETRHESVISMIRDMDDKYSVPDFGPIILHMGDFELSVLHYTFSKADSYFRCIPDHTFHSWKESRILDYTKETRFISDAGKMIPYQFKAGWIGNIRNHWSRKELKWYGNNNGQFLDIFDSKETQFMSLPMLVRMYAFLIDVRGTGYSGRLKYLLWSRRPVLLVERNCNEYWMEHLEPWVHYIPVKHDCSDVVEKVQWCLLNYTKSIAIADTAHEFAQKHLTYDAVLEKWRDVLIKSATQDSIT